MIKGIFYYFCRNIKHWRGLIPDDAPPTYHNMMKHSVLLTLFISLTCISAHAAGCGDKAMQVKEVKLSNGLTVWVSEDHSLPKVFGAVVVKAGAADCPNTGIAHYFEHIMFKGTDKIGTVDYEKERPWLDSISAKYDLLAQTEDAALRSQIQNDINRLGAKAAEYAIPNEFSNLVSRYGGSGLNAATSLDYTVYYNTFLPQYVDQWALLNSERLISPVFRLFQSELETVYEEKNMYADNVLMSAYERVMENFFSGTPYAYPVVGSTENLKNPRLSEMRSFYDKYYVAGNMALILAGDVCADSIVPLLERTFGRIRPGDAPERQTFTPVSLASQPEVRLRIPFPIVKGELVAFRTPPYGHADEAALDLAVRLLTNNFGSGKLDSICNDGDALMAMAMTASLKNAGITFVAGVPSLPFGSRRKLMRKCMEQVDKVKNGDFGDGDLQALKMEAVRELKRKLEDADKRGWMMVEAYGNGEDSWAEYIAREQAIENVNRNDVMRVARKYFNNEYMDFVKKFGRYPSDKVSQPGYKPMPAKNITEQSAYAAMLDSLGNKSVEPRIIDFERDASRVSLGRMAELYTVKNDKNDVFTLQLVYHKGKVADPRLEVVEAYIDALGTDSLTSQQFRRALQNVGATLDFSAGNNSFTISMQGFERNLEPSLRLLGHFMSSVKPDKKQMSEMKKAWRLNDMAFEKDNSSLAQAALSRISYGSRSSYLNRVTVKDVKKMKPEELVGLFDSLQNVQLSVVYCGSRDASSVRQDVRKFLPVEKASEPYIDTYKPLMQYAEPAVYIFDNPRARQAVVATYTPLAPVPEENGRTCLKLWSRYFGNGMSSVMFQELRELRSFAYYAYGSPQIPSPALHADAPTAFISMMGTQADKTMDAVATLDSLFADMPVRDKNMSDARLAMLNSINNSYPSFRNIGQTIALYRAQGYKADPDAALVESLNTVTDKDVYDYYNKNVKGRPYILIIVGDKSKLDMQKLSKYGKITDLKLEEIYRM